MKAWREGRESGATRAARPPAGQIAAGADSAAHNRAAAPVCCAGKSDAEIMRFCQSFMTVRAEPLPPALRGRQSKPGPSARRLQGLSWNLLARRPFFDPESRALFPRVCRSSFGISAPTSTFRPETLAWGARRLVRAQAALSGSTQTPAGSAALARRGSCARERRLRAALPCPPPGCRLYVWPVQAHYQGLWRRPVSKLGLLSLHRSTARHSTACRGCQLAAAALTATNASRHLPPARPPCLQDRQGVSRLP